MSALHGSQNGFGCAAPRIWDCLAQYRLSIAVVLADLAVSPVDKYVALRGAIMVSAFMGLGHTYATQGHEADESGCVHGHWADVSCPILLGPWRRGTAPSPCMVADLAKLVKSLDI